MRFMARKGQDEPPSLAEEDARVQELRASLGQLNERDTRYATDACLVRYLRARNWNVKKAEKMLRDTLQWRATYKPEDIRWEDIAKEAETGKVFRVPILDKQGRSVLMMRPAKQNTTSREGQIKQLVYSMENAISNLPEGQEEMVWLVDFKNWSKNISIKLAQESAYVLQRHYPERLGVGILLNPPHIFEAFWQVGFGHKFARTMICISGYLEFAMHLEFCVLLMSLEVKIILYGITVITVEVIC
ncbi:hypothetical protein KC19_5G048100 [Ceratodon purpureus]|uniref:CRAL-TRIO domain-containing protein n=1 Tax=Ceratodon purpureus TaxID=3225 RepID=A0A8T0HZ01_CERPU|nr:hypothetical protein KC19_5G048100 [Ceratodon purpureus]